LLEEEILISKEKTKFNTKNENFTIIIDFPHLFWKKNAENQEENIDPQDATIYN
jgi:hypothetical protein